MASALYASGTNTVFSSVHTKIADIYRCSNPQVYVKSKVLIHPHYTPSIWICLENRVYHSIGESSFPTWKQPFKVYTLRSDKPKNHIIGCIDTYIYIFMYIERGREREKERKKERDVYIYIHIYIYIIYIYIIYIYIYKYNKYIYIHSHWCIP
jgi:hypothetical protein